VGEWCWDDKSVDEGFLCIIFINDREMGRWKNGKTNNDGGPLSPLYSTLHVESLRDSSGTGNRQA